jgi:hypothetical protein
MAYSRQQLLLLCLCWALALTPIASIAVESYALKWSFISPATFYVSANGQAVEAYIPGRLINTTECDPNGEVSCPGVDDIDVTINAEGTAVTVAPLERRPARPVGVHIGSSNTSAAVAPHPSGNPHKLAPGIQPNTSLQKASGNSTPGQSKLESSCTGCPLVVKTFTEGDAGTFYLKATYSVVGTTVFTASAEVGGQTISTGPLDVIWAPAILPPTYKIAWATDGPLQAPVPGQGFFVYGQIYDADTCPDFPDGASCAGPSDVAVTVSAAGADVTLSYGDAAGKHHVLPDHAHSTLADRATPTTGHQQQEGLSGRAPARPPLPGDVHRTDKVANAQQPAKQSCASPQDCASTLTVYTGLIGYFVVYVSPGASNNGGTTDLAAAADYLGQSLSTTTPLSILWYPAPVLDFDTISLAPAGVKRVSLGSKAKLTATVTSPNGTPVPGITVNFIVTLALDEVQSLREANHVTAQVAAASTNSKAKPAAAAATPAAALPITKQATSKENGKAVLKLSNPKRDRPGSYKVVAYATNNQGDVVKSDPVLVVWEDEYESYGDHGYG